MSITVGMPKASAGLGASVCTLQGVATSAYDAVDGSSTGIAMCHITPAIQTPPMSPRR